MTRLARILTALLSLITLGTIVGVWIGLPYLERRWSDFPPAKEILEKPWDLPEGGEKVSFAAADGVRLAGWYFEAKPPRTGITILVLHGRYGTLPGYVPDAEAMRRRGFNVLLFNFRGFGMSDGVTVSEATLDRDAAAALHYLTKERGIEPHSIALVGASSGAPIASNLAARAPCRAIAIVSGIASAKRQMQHARPWVPAIILDHLSNPLDAIAMISRAKCPVLVIHAANDSVVPLAHAQEVYDAARPPKRLLVVPGTGHGFDDASRSIYLEEMAAFFTNPK
jgi:pimeloyl-ACP methyl ester carboxylesterase